MNEEEISEAYEDLDSNGEGYGISYSRGEAGIGQYSYGTVYVGDLKGLINALNGLSQEIGDNYIDARNWHRRKGVNDIDQLLNE